MLNLFRALLPREERFFDLFAKHSDEVAAGAKALRQMLEGGDAVPRHYKTVMEREHDADGIARQVLVAVRRTFIAPFDRGDIKDLITAMDDAIDQMQKTAKVIVLFEMTAFAPQMRSIADHIGHCSELVRRAMPLLANIGQHAGQLTEICQQISRIEGQADDLYDQGLKQLYARVKGGDAMEFVRSNEIYDHLEKSVDRFDDIANQIQGIVIEHV